MLVLDPMKLRDAEMTDLVQTFARLTGTPVKAVRFPSRVIAERKVEQAILAAKDRAGHRGVPPNTDPDPLAGCGEDDCEHPDKVCACMADTLIKKPLKTPPPRKPRAGAILSITATFAGLSKPNPGSQRAAVLEAIQKSPKATTTLAALEQQLGYDCRGYVQKLLAKEHILVKVQQ